MIPGLPPRALVGAVVPAAGAGVRMGGRLPKQFREIGGMPVLIRALRALAASEAIGATIVAAPPEAVGSTSDLLAEHGLKAEVVAGGTTRGASVRLAMEVLPEHVDLVVVHDAARPFVSPEVVRRVVAAIAEHGAAAAALPVADTLRRAAPSTGSGQAGARLGATVERDGLWAMQTPQGARRDLLVAAYAALGDDTATDEAGLLLAAGTPVHIVEGDARAFKLTRPSDVLLAEALAAEHDREHGSMPRLSS